jgi:hypothetical protein
VKQQQLDPFLAIEEHRFEERAMAQLREHFPEELKGLDEQRLLAFIRAGRDKAVRYGIESYREVALFLGAMAELGADFDTSADHRWAREILDDPRFDAECKMDLVYARLLEKQAAAERGSSDHV